MPIAKRPDCEPIRGYRLLEPLGNGGCGEVWKCEAPGGIFKAIKFVYGDLESLTADSARAEEELRAVQRIKSIRHPFLLSIDRVENVDGELLIVTELADQNLDQVLCKYRAQGLAGIPRSELLGYLREAAEVLDLMNLKFDLQHLDIKPRNLFLVSNHVKVADFGLVSNLGGGNGTEAKVQLGGITPLYASPEVFLGKLSRHCDQYSLAIVFQELLTGTLPFKGKNSRQLLLQHTQAEPDLTPLPEEDRPLIARALAKNPEHRFASCMDMIQALLTQGRPPQTSAVPKTSEAQSASAAAPAAETIRNSAPDTEKNRPRNLPPLPKHVLAGYSFLECLGNTPLSDLWKVLAPDGSKRLVKFLNGCADSSDSKRLKKAARWLQALNHPALVPSAIVHIEPGRVVLLTDLVQKTLRDRFQQCQSGSLAGIPRAELVDYLRAAAEVLDYLYQQHAVQHLSLNPRNLILDHGWLQITDFGLAQLLRLPAQLNARYAAPEQFEKNISRSCDQYSLAILYVEMLTGSHPFSANPVAPGKRGLPHLDKLPASDREIIARALHSDPGQRWANCSDMAMALEGTPPEQEVRAQPDRFTRLIQEPRSAPPRPIAGATSDNLQRILADIIHSAGGKVDADDLEDSPELSADGDLVTHKFQASLPIGSARQKLESFHHLLFGQRIRDHEDGLDIYIDLPGNFWRKLLGEKPGLEIHISLRRVKPRSTTPIEVSAQIHACGCRPTRCRELLEEMSPTILDSLRKLLLVNSEKRTQERLPWPHPVRVIPILPGGGHDEAIDCRGKDISTSGLGFYLPHELTTADVLIELPNSVHPPVICLPATLVRAKRCADGWYDVGALFRLPVLRKSSPEILLAQ
jgi:serine/threonine protein kinase